MLRKLLSSFHIHMCANRIISLDGNHVVICCRCGAQKWLPVFRDKNIFPVMPHQVKEYGRWELY